MRSGCTVVLDIGKTAAKLSVWSQTGELLDQFDRRNIRVEGAFAAVLDVEGIEQWLEDALKEAVRRFPVTTIVPTAHGAAAAILRNGALLCPPLDYEQPIPAATRARYAALRDAFSITGSPLLPNGLNLGLQLAWLEELIPNVLTQDDVIVPWPQYWAWLLAGVAASEVTSLGSHTDLWQPLAQRPSPLAVSRGWASRLAPLRRANEVLGVIQPDWVARTGLSPQAQVLCGLHDSNAALNAARCFPELAGKDAAVLSTGTWFVAMRALARTPQAHALPEHRDCLLNVDWHGNAVPSARFMGGREIEVLTAGSAFGIDVPAAQMKIIEAIPEVVREGCMFLPTCTPGVGPFPKGVGRLVGPPVRGNDALAAVSLYAALNADVCLKLIGARGSIVVEGRFARAEGFVRALSSLRGGGEVFVSRADDGVPLGALRLVNPALTPREALELVQPLDCDLSAYAANWRKEAEALRGAA